MLRTYQSMLEVSHAHLPMMALVVLLLTHLLIFAPFQFKTKMVFIISGFSFALCNESAGWLVRFVHPGFAVLKVSSFLAFQGVLGFLMVVLVIFLIRKPARKTAGENTYATIEVLRSTTEICSQDQEKPFSDSTKNEPYDKDFRT
jgi:hypothetical protein